MIDVFHMGKMYPKYITQRSHVLILYLLLSKCGICEHWTPKSTDHNWCHWNKLTQIIFTGMFASSHYYLGILVQLTKYRSSVFLEGRRGYCNIECGGGRLVHHIETKLSAVELVVVGPTNPTHPGRNVSCGFNLKPLMQSSQPECSLRCQPHCTQIHKYKY